MGRLGRAGWFYVRTASEGWAPWWEQGNEHRFLLSRILFWVEFHFFGDLKFLLAMNVVLLLAISGVFSLLIRRSGMAQEGAVSPGALTLFIAGAAFSWMQQENLRWEVASQIYLAHLLPLLPCRLGPARTRLPLPPTLRAPLSGRLSASRTPLR